MTEPEIRISIIGPPLVTRNGQPLKISRRLHRAILYYVAAKLQPVTRGQICGLFWPEEPEEIARKNLREALSCLRSALGQDALLAAENQVGLNPLHATCDLPDFVRLMDPLLSSAEMKSSGPLPEAMVQLLRNQLQFGRTNQIIQGVNLPHLPDFENWKELTRQSFNYTRARTLDRLIDHYISSGDLEEALIWLERAIEINPLDVNQNYLVLSCLKDLGRSTELIEYVDYLAGLYQQHEEILPTRFVELQKQARITLEEPGKVNTTPWGPLVPGEVKFFNRKAQLDALTKAYYRKGIVRLVGGVGAGKTRLLREFYNQLPYQPRLVYGQSVPLAAKVPFRTIIDAITRVIHDEEWLLMEQSDRDLMDAFVYEYLRDWEKLKELEDEEHPLPLLENVFGATYRLLEKFSLGRPVLFILDDALWLDQASVTLLGYLTEKEFFRKNGMLVIVTRPEISNRPLEHLITQLERRKKVETIQLENFAEEETDLFIQHMTGSKCHPDYLRKFQLSTGGNPFYLIECIQEVKRTNLDIAMAPGQMNCPTPSIIETLALEKIKQLTPDGIKVLHAGAVLGNSFTPKKLELMLGEKNDLLLEAIEQLKTAGLLSVDAQIQPGGGYRFPHDIEREVVLKGLDPARKRTLHLKAARALLKHRGEKTELAAEIAHHFEVANELDQALKYWLMAAEIAHSNAAHASTYEAYDHAIHLISTQPYQFSTELIHQLVSDYSSFLLEQDDIPTGEKVYQTCLELGEKRNDQLLLGTGLSGLGVIAGRKYEFENCRQLFHMAVLNLKEAGHPGELIEAYSRIGILSFMADEYIGAKQALELGLEVQNDKTDAHSMDAWINLSTRLCIILCFMGYPKRALELAQEMTEVSRGVPRNSAVVQAITTLALAQYYCGNFQEAINSAISVRPMAERQNIHFWQSLLDIVLGRCHLMLGNPDKSWFYINDAIDREQIDPFGKLYDQARLSKGDLYRLSGDYKNAVLWYQAVIDTGLVNYQTIEALHHQGLTQTYLGRIAEGETNIRKSIALAKQKGISGSEYNARLTLFFTHKFSDPPEPWSGITTMVEEMQSRGMMYAEEYGVLLNARELEMCGDPLAAVGEFEKAAEIAWKSGAVWFEYYALGKILSLGGKKSASATKARIRLEQISELLAGNTRNPAVRTMFRKFPRVET